MAEQDKDITGQGQDAGGGSAAGEKTGQGKAASAAAETGKSRTSKSKKPKVISRARYVGNSPVKAKQGDRAIMLWPNQVYKDLEETEDVAFLIKKRMLKKIK
jgi:hypothetical protein